MEKKNLVRLGGGLLGLVVVVLGCCYLGGAFERKAAPPAVTRERDASASKQRVDKNVIERLQERVTKQEQEPLVSESQEESSAEEVVPQTADTTTTTTATPRTAGSGNSGAVRPELVKTEADQSAPTIKSIPSKKQKKSSSSEVDPKDVTAPKQKAVIPPKGDSTPKKKADKPVMKWTPEPSKLKLSLFGKYFYQLADFINRLTSGKEKMKALVEAAQELVNSLFSDYLKIINNNKAAIDESSRQLGQEEPVDYAETIAYMKGTVSALITEETLKWAKLILGKEQSLFRSVVLMIHQLFPVITRLPSFESFKFEDEDFALKSHAIVYDLMLGMGTSDMKAEVFAHIKKTISSPQVIKGLKTVYAGKDFSLLLASKSFEELAQAALYMSKDPANVPALIVVGSVLEEPVVRIFHKFFKHLLVDERFDTVLKLAGKVLSLVQNFSVDVDMAKSWEVITKDLMPLLQDAELYTLIEKTFELENLEQCARDAFGPERAAELLEMFSDILSKIDDMKTKVSEVKESFGKPAAPGSTPMDDVKRTMGYSEFQLTQLRITSSLIVQVILRLANNSKDPTLPEWVEAF